MSVHKCAYYYIPIQSVRQFEVLISKIYHVVITTNIPVNINFTGEANKYTEEGC